VARRTGKKYPLLVYRHIVSRWWFALIVMGLGLFALAYSEYIQPLAEFLPQRWQVFAAIGALAVTAGVFFFVIRFMAYVQPNRDHLRIVTPFLHMDISYKRIRKTVTTEMRQLFPPKSLSGWMQDIFSPLSTKTALVIELTGYPIPRPILRLFLSRFFFKDTTPHLVLLVEDWLRFSSELDSMRTGTDPEPDQRRPKDSILSRLPHNR
jgi:hypothetical protein